MAVTHAKPCMVILPRGVVGASFRGVVGVEPGGGARPLWLAATPVEYWNAGLFSLCASCLFSLLSRHMPDVSVGGNFRLCAGERIVERCNTSGYSCMFRSPSPGQSSSLTHTTDGSMRALARIHQEED